VIDSIPGWRIGVVGISEYEWIASLNSIDPGDLHFENIVDSCDYHSEILSI